MAALSSGDPSHHGTPEEIDKVSQEKLEEGGGRWYFSKKEIEENSPSRQDGIDLEKESNLRWRYSRFIQDLGKALKVPQVAIATAIVFCHRFFLRQSHAKNDCKIISTVCLFLACKVEDSPRPLRVFIQELESLLQKKEVNEELEKLIWVRERVVLTTLGFDLIVHHPYKPLGKAIKKFKVPQNPFAQVAWNLINDGLQTTLCLQFKPHQIAAGAFFLAGTINKLKLPSGYKSAWLKEFDVTPEQLKEISGQMWVSYNRNRASRSQASKAEGSGARSERPPPLIGPANKSTDGNEGHDEDDDQEGNSIKTQDTIQVKDECDHGKNLSSRERTAAQLTQEAYEKLDVEKIKVTIKRRKALRGNIGFKVDPTDELEKELEDVELPGKSEKIEKERKQNSSSCGDELEEGEVGPYDDADMGSLSPTSTGNSNPGEPLDMPMEGDQPSDSA